MAYRVKLHRTEHEKVADDLSAYVDDQLLPEGQARVEAHVAGCERCRQDLRTLRWTRDLLAQTPRVPAPRSFVIREADLQPRRAPRWRSLFALQWATAVVSLLFVLVLAGDLIVGGGMMSRQAAPAPLLQSDAAPAESVALEETGVVVLEREVQAPGAYAGPSPEVGLLQSSQETLPAPEVTVWAEDGRGEKAGSTAAVGAVPEAAAEAQTTPEDRALAPKAMLAEGPPPGAPDATAAPEQTAEPPARVMAAPETEQAVPSAKQPVESPAPEQSGLGADEEAPAPDVQSFAWRGVWRGIEVGLGVLLVGLVVGVAVLRRKDRF